MAGGGIHVDVSMLEAMSATIGGFGGLFADMFGYLDAARSFTGAVRSLEVPSIVPTVDGLIGFCTVTRQQFEDFMLMIDQSTRAPAQSSGWRSRSRATPSGPP
jgi:crotonobetainyl-CoA:carnitine CoA-transferase CaiB-like acyl-CoA transferase